jgi:small subunit ribosomal protein S19
MAKKYSFRGKSIEELQAMPIDSFVSLLDSRSRRAMKRLAPRLRALLAKVKKSAAAGKAVRTHIREAIILPQWVGLAVAVHNGKEFKQFSISPEMVGHRLGEFAHTTGRVAHSGPGVGATRGSKFLPLK